MTAKELHTCVRAHRLIPKRPAEYIVLLIEPPEVRTNLNSGSVVVFSLLEIARQMACGIGIRKSGHLRSNLFQHRQQIFAEFFRVFGHGKMAHTFHDLKGRGVDFLC